MLLFSLDLCILSSNKSSNVFFKKDYLGDVLISVLKIMEKHFSNKLKLLSDKRRHITWKNHRFLLYSPISLDII